MIQVRCGGLPVVLCDRQVRDYNFDIVTTDQHEAMFHLLNHLKQQGYTRPLFLVEPWENNSVRMKRREAFLEIIHTLYGYDASEDVYMLKPGGESAVQVLQRALGRNNLGIPAVIGCNSITTVRAFHAIQELGLSIPEEIGLCGPEDWDWSNEMNWPFIIAPILRQSRSLLHRSAVEPLLCCWRSWRDQNVPQKRYCSLACSMNGLPQSG